MKKLLALIAASLALCACDTVNTVERANPSANKKMVDDIRIVTDSAVDDYAYVAGINEAKTQGGLLKIQAEIVNRSSAYRNVSTSTSHASPMFTRTSLARERTRLICREPPSREI